ncbi:MAG: hypothetical protein A2Y89_01765 [Chloroflexi bacterium RBG_13_51_18]|nr:MAG: hypothetical protein A2Y89_01765 [Chloroflexi bacterium RBG_13_51_18]
MKAVRFINGWTITAILLVIVIVAGIVIISQKANPGQAVEMAMASEREVTGRIYIGGEVYNPGYYPIFSGDSLGDIIAAAGGLKEGADLTSVELTISGIDDENTTQKININRAEAWLLEALPGVGEVKAQAIIEYRLENGPFRDINELKQVPGFGESSFDMVKEMITVNE